MVSLWSLPGWELTLLGGCISLAVVVQERLYPLPAPGDPTNRGWLAIFHGALALSRWVMILAGGCLVALGLILWTS